MEPIYQFFRNKTEDFPLSVNYFSPLGISPRGAILQRDSHAGFEFLFILSGLVEVFIDGNQTVCGGGDYIFLSPWQVHSFRTLRMDTYYINMKFSLELLALPQTHFFSKQVLQPLIQNQLILPQIVRPEHPAHPQLEQLISALDAQKEGQDTYTLQLLSILFGIFAILFPHCTQKDSTRDKKQTSTSVTRQTIQFIQDHYSQRLTMEQIAEHVHLHPNYLSVLFKQATGKTVMTYLNQVRISQSCRLLRHSNLPINQIAELCGFQSAGFFTRRFQQIVNCTPRVYRKRQPPER